MATIAPFKGLRYNEDKVYNLAAVFTPPYDIIDDTAQARYYAQHPANIIRLELGMIFPQDSATNNRYTRAAKYLNKWIEDEILVYEDKPALYLYQQEFTIDNSQLTRTGFICALKVEDYSRGNILPHEETLSKPKADRLQLMKTTHCNFSSIFGMFSDADRRIDKLLLEQVQECNPDIEIIDENNETHRVWAITDEAVIAQVVEAMTAQKIYIADGHHRYETALEYARQMKAEGYEGYDYVLATLVNLYDEGLVVLPTHRLVGNIHKFDPAKFSQQLSELFTITKSGHRDDLPALLAQMKAAGKQQHVFGMYTADGELQLLTLKSEEQAIQLLPADQSAAWKKLDVAILDNLILNHMLGIGEQERRNQDNLAYTHDANQLIQQVDSSKYQIGFLLNPTRVEQVVAVAQGHDKMPQKSTYFYPKLITGLVINNLASK